MLRFWRTDVLLVADNKELNSGWLREERKLVNTCHGNIQVGQL